MGATADGIPTTGTFAIGDFVISQADGAIYVCTTAGTPGTWATYPTTAYAMPTGAVAETFLRDNLSNAAALTTQKAYFTAIRLIAGTTVTSATFGSGNTLAGTPTNWWFALYDSSLNVIRQSTDQLTAAWAANAGKTLALDSIPVTAGSRSGSTLVTLTVPTLSQTLATIMATGDSCAVSNANIAAYNGTFSMTVVNNTTITYTSGGSATDSLAAPFPTIQLASGKRTYVPTTSGRYYVVVMVKATTVPTMVGGNSLVNAATWPMAVAPITGGQDATNTSLTGTAVSPAAALTGAAFRLYSYLT